MIDGCTPLRTFFSVVLPVMKQTYISVGIPGGRHVDLERLPLPYLVLDLNKYKTISIAIQYMKGSYGRVDMGAVMAALIPCGNSGSYLLSGLPEAHYYVLLLER